MSAVKRRRLNGDGVPGQSTKLDVKTDGNDSILTQADHEPKQEGVVDTVTKSFKDLVCNDPRFPLHQI